MPKVSRDCRTARELRESLTRVLDGGASQREVAAAIGESPNRVLTFLGGSDCQISFAEKLADYLGTPLLPRQRSK